jgi:alpha-1,6-mannosyltransferase
MSVQSPLGRTPQSGSSEFPAPTELRAQAELRSSGLELRAASGLRSQAGLAPPVALPVPALELPVPGLPHAPGLRARWRSGATIGHVALIGVFACAVLIAIAAAGTDSFLPQTVSLAIPSWLTGPLGNAGLDIGVVGVLAVLITMFASYAVAVQVSDRLSARAILLTIAGVNLAIVLAPPLLSTDVFSYQIYGRMGALYSTNPYLHGPHAVGLDPLYQFIGSKWVSTPSAYGPLFTAMSYVLAPLSIAASAVWYKAIAEISCVVTLALLWHAARLRNLDPVRAVALFGLNPLIVVYGVGGGHNDLLMLAVMVGAVVAALHFRDRVSGALVVVSTAVKLTAVLLLPFLVARNYAKRDDRRPLDALIGAGIGALAMGALTFALFGTGPLNLPSTLETIQHEGDWHSIPGFISTRLGLGGVGHATGVVLAVAFVIVYAILIRRVARGELDWIHGAGWATAALLLTTSSLLPWYVAWLVPFAALATDRRLLKMAIVMTGLIQGIELLGYIPHGSSLLGL